MSEPTDIGQQLLKARELKNLSPKDIEQSTRIPSATITALESNDFSALPTSYARSFLTQYSEYLKVDASDLIDSLVPDEDITNIGYLKTSQDTVSEKRGSSPKSRPNRKRKKGLGQLESPTKHDDGKKMAQPLALIGLAILIIIAAFFFFTKFQSPKSSTAHDSVDINKPTDERMQSELADTSPDQQIKTGDNALGIFDPLSTPKDKLSPEQDLVSLQELVGLASDNFANQITDNDVTPAESKDTDDSVAGQSPPQRSSPPPKAMLIEE
ncbi:MAG: helix-turn-helix transcriptional regulator [Akkermansiaceae bacterium]|nr:helix-turn-helix transcriptional regulator [Akkermansiaceae bacterium]